MNNLSSAEKPLKGFTLLEIIVTIIVFMTLLGLAIPRLFSRIESARSVEASKNFISIRSSMERCRFQTQSFEGCDLDGLDIDDPSSSVGTHFTYSIYGQTTDGYYLMATRNDQDNGDETSTITLEQTGSGASISGTGAFQGIK